MRLVGVEEDDEKETEATTTRWLKFLSHWLFRA
jgi:hypothetical protein